jgi:hypothetical protein
MPSDEEEETEIVATPHAHVSDASLWVIMSFQRNPNRLGLCATCFASLVTLYFRVTGRSVWKRWIDQSAFWK